MSDSSPPVVDPVGNPPEAEDDGTTRSAKPVKKAAKAQASRTETQERTARVSPAPEERPYSKAVSKEHKEFLKSEGVEL